MLTLIGGKYTTIGVCAERVVDRVVRATRVRAGRCTTAESPLPGRMDAIAKLGAQFPGRLGPRPFARDHGGGGGHPCGWSERGTSGRARASHQALARRGRHELLAGPVSRWMAPHLGWNEGAAGREVDRVTQALDQERDIIDSALEGAGTGAGGARGRSREPP